MNTKLKLIALKTSKVATKVVMVGTIVTGLAAYGMQFLPTETYNQVLDLINTSRSMMSQYSISATGIGTALLVGTQGLKIVNSAIGETDLKLQAMETDLKKKINKELAIGFAVDEKVVDKLNTLIALEEKRTKQNDILIGFNVITAKRNMSLSDDLVPMEQKALYEAWLDDLTTVQYDVKPITKVIETKEIHTKLIEVPIKKVKTNAKTLY